MRRRICLASVMLALCVGCSGGADKETKESLQTQETEAVSEMDLHIETEDELFLIFLDFFEHFLFFKVFLSL